MKQARYAGAALLATTLALFVTFAFSDPGLETPDDREAFAEEVTSAAAKLPGAGWALGVEMSLAVLATLAGAGLYQLVRTRAPGLGAAGSAMLVLFGLFHAVQAMVAAAMFTAAREYVDGGLVEPGGDQVLVLLNTISDIHWTAWLGAWVTLGLAIIWFAYGLAWPVRRIPRWLGGGGIAVGALLSTIALAPALEPVFLTWFIGTVLGFAWLLVTSGWLLLATRRTGAAVTEALDAERSGSPAR